MYQRGILSIIMIVAGLVIILILIGLFSGSFTKEIETTTTTTTYYGN